MQPIANFLFEKQISVILSGNWKLTYVFLSFNKSPEAFRIIEKNLDKISWDALCENKYIEVIYLLEKNQDKINWDGFSGHQPIFYLNYKFINKI